MKIEFIRLHSYTIFLSDDDIVPHQNSIFDTSSTQILQIHHYGLSILFNPIFPFQMTQNKTKKKSIISLGTSR